MAVVELAIGVLLFVITLAVLSGVPRAVGTTGDGGHGQRGYPDIPAALDGFVGGWLRRGAILDLVAGILSIIVLGVGVLFYRNPGTVGVAGEGTIGAIGVVLMLVGLALVGLVSFLNVRRSGFSNGEALLIAGILGGSGLILLVLLALLETG